MLPKIGTARGGQDLLASVSMPLETTTTTTTLERPRTGEAQPLTSARSGAPATARGPRARVALQEQAVGTPRVRRPAGGKPAVVQKDFGRNGPCRHLPRHAYVSAHAGVNAGAQIAAIPSVGDTGDGVPVVPGGYSVAGAPRPRWGPCLPEYELWVTLRGGNGTWAKQKALSTWEDQMQQHREYEEQERQKEAERRRQRKLLAEAERKRKEDLERYIASHEQRELERRQKLEEQQRLEAEREAESIRKREEEARWLAKLKPRDCHKCSGSGQCPKCEGKGFIFLFYPASTCSMNLYPTAASSRNYGRVNGGCPACGGCGDETWSNYVPGSGQCRTCAASGKVQAPVGGWPD